MTKTTTLARVSQEKQPLSEAVRGIISKVLTGKKADDFVTALVSLVNQNPDLSSCDRISLAASALQAQSLNLSLNKNLGQAWIVPFEDGKNKRTMATFQIGYKGYIQLAIRSGQYRKLNVITIKEGELKYFDPLNEELEVELIQDEEERSKTPTIGYYAMFEYLNGFRKAMYWSKVKMETHAKKYSPAYAKDVLKKTSYSFWSKDFDAMASKTMLRQIIGKWGIMSTDIIQALDVDMKMAKDVNDFSDIAAFESLNAAETAAVVDTDAITLENAPMPPDEAKIESTTETENSKQTADRQRAAKAASRVKAKENAQADLQTMAAPPGPAQMETGAIQCPKEWPDGNSRIVTEADCIECGSRPGCPAWSEEW